MKKKKLVIVSLIIVLIFSGTASLAFLNDWFGGAKDTAELVNDISEIDISYADSFASAAKNSLSAVVDMAQSYNLTDISYEEYMSVEAYIVFMLRHTPSPAEIQEINSLLKSGTTIQTVSEIYDFYLTTNDDFSIIADIAALENKYWGRHWIENAYNHITENRTGVLTKEDIEEYSQTLSREDMEYANILCRKGIYTVHELLDKRAGGESWDALTEDIYSKTASDNASGSGKERNEAFRALSANELSDNNMIAVYELSPFLSKTEAPLSLNDIESDISKIENEMKDKYNYELVSSVNQQLKNLGLPESFMTGEEYEAYYNTHYSNAEANGLIKSEINLLEQKGYSMEEIANASANYNGDIFDVLDNLKEQREVNW